MVVTGAEVVVHHQLQVLGHEDEVHAAEAELRQAQEDGDQDSEILTFLMRFLVKKTPKKSTRFTSPNCCKL